MFAREGYDWLDGPRSTLRARGQERARVWYVTEDSYNDAIKRGVTTKWSTT